MDAETMALLTGLLGTVLGTVLFGGALLGAWLLGRERGRREVRTGDSASVTSASREDIERLEQGYDAMRGELERLSEDQRFTMRLLAERAPTTRGPLAGPPPNSKARTPAPPSGV
jgi:hypothetical protein